MVSRINVQDEIKVVKRSRYLCRYLQFVVLMILYHRTDNLFVPPKFGAGNKLTNVKQTMNALDPFYKIFYFLV